ncbi:MAG: aminopeptidase [Myxococcales bacterium]|nr:aminopeptidase [Myxococcales bacterium]
MRATWLGTARACVASCALVASAGCYELRQAGGQLDMFLHRRALSSLVDDPSLTAEQRDRLRVVWYARDFALRELGLSASESYTSVVMLSRPAVSYVVAASPPDRIASYRWCFPFAGCLPYIGYFDRRDAVRERDRLRRLGYDTYLRGVDAYSLGGWFPDPVYSPMLERTRGGVANTVIHELTHGTLFVASEARFNESLATYVGDRGSLLFLAQRYGERSSTYREALAIERDAARWERFLRALAARLQRVYASDATREDKLRRKEQILREARAAFERGELGFETPQFRVRAGRLEINNAVLSNFVTYYGDQELIDAAYRAFGGSLRDFIVFLKREVAPQRRPSEWLSRWTQARGARSAP